MLHSYLPEAIYGSSAVVLNNVMYNIGGYLSSRSVAWCRLKSKYVTSWQFMDLSNSNFKGYSWREALVVENKIVYFGSSNENRTFVLEKEEQSEKLRVVRQDEGIDLRRGFWNSSSCVFKNEIYAFKRRNYGDVHIYSL